MTVTIYHNPRCSKSRQTLRLIEDRGIEPEIVTYLTDTPSAEELTEIIGLLGVGARDIMRTGEAIYKELGLKDETSETALITAMVHHPILIERPIVVSNGKAVIGRPPEAVLPILEP